MRSAYFYSCIGGFVAGVGFHSLFRLHVTVLLLIAVLTVVVAFLSRRGRDPLLAVVILFCVLFVFGVVRTEFRLEATSPTPASLTEEEVTVVGEVVVFPERSARSQTLVLEPREMRVGDTRLAMDERIRVSAHFYPEVGYGDVVRVVGEVTRPDTFETETGRTFDYPNYLRKDNIGLQMFYPELEIVESDTGWSVRGTLFRVREAFTGAIARVVPEPEAALVAGTTVGVDEGLGDDLERLFRTTGIIHIVVLSGYNVTIVAEAIMRLFGFLALGLRTGLGVGAIVLFAILTGGGAAIVRASIMAVLVLIARATGRTSDMTRALFFAGALMVLHNPLILFHDPGFELSFLATFGLIALSPLIEQRLKLVPTKLQIRELVTATVATQIFVLPFLLYLIGEFSLVAVPVNILVLPMIPPLMFVGFFTGVLGFISTTLASLLGLVTTFMASYVFMVVEFFGNLPFASWIASPFSFSFVVIAYAGLLWVVYPHTKGL